MSTKRLFIPMTKYDAEKGIAYGVAASSSLDRSGEIFDYAGSKPHFEKWSAAAVAATAGKSFGNLRSMHGNVAAGKLEQITFNDDDELIEIAAKVVDPVEQKKCEEGVYTGFSMGGKYIKKWTDKENPKATRYIADPYEISLVDLPCIPDATFEYVKAAGVMELRKFHVEAVTGDTKEPTNADVVAKAEMMAVEKGRPGDWLTFVDEARKSLTTTPATTDELAPKHVLELAITAVEDDAVGKTAGTDEAWQQAWIHPRLPGKTFAKKDDLRTALTELDATETAVKLAAPANAALKALTDVLDERDPAGVAKNSSDNPDFAGKDKDAKDKKDAKEAPAKSGAKPKDEKTKAKEEADKAKPMKSAIDVIARAKLLAAATVPSFVERREIIKAATEFNALAVLPDGFIDAPDMRLAKGASDDLKKAATLYNVSSLIGLVAQLESFHSTLCGVPDYGYYGGDSITRIEVSDETKNTISDLCDQLGAAAAMMLDEILSEMKEEEAEKAVGRGTVLADLRKVGARNSAGDKTRLRKAHDLLAEIEPEMCGAEKHVHADGDDVQKRLTAQESAFTKTVEGIVDVIKDVAERVKRIEAQPVAGRPTHVNVVEKFASVGDGLFSNEPSAHDQNHAAFIEMAADRARLGAPQR